MTHVSFEAVLQASDQAISLALSAQACQTCLVRKDDALIMVCSRLISLLEAAVMAYTPAVYQADPNSEAATIICIPSPMFTGTLELDPRQSISLAFGLIKHRLLSLGGFLAEMEHESALAVQNRALRLLVPVNAVLQRVLQS